MTVQLENIAQLAVMAGELMLKNGAETKRVEETMAHIAYACGADTAEGFAIPTGVFLTVGCAIGPSLTTIRRVHVRLINLERIDKVNALSRRLAEHRIGVEDALALLARIDQEPAGFPPLPSLAACGLVGGTTAALQNAAIPEMGGAFLAAASVHQITQMVQGVQFTAEFLGGIAVALVGTLLHAVWPGISRDAVIIGGIMPLVPGMAITNAIRDFIAGDLLSGMSRGIEAGLTAGAVAMGVFLVLAVSIWQ